MQNQLWTPSGAHSPRKAEDSLSGETSLCLGAHPDGYNHAATESPGPIVNAVSPRSWSDRQLCGTSPFRVVGTGRPHGVGMCVAEYARRTETRRVGRPKVYEHGTEAVRADAGRARDRWFWRQVPALGNELTLKSRCRDEAEPGWGGCRSTASARREILKGVLPNQSWTVGRRLHLRVTVCSDGAVAALVGVWD